MRSLVGTLHETVEDPTVCMPELARIRSFLQPTLPREWQPREAPGIDGAAFYNKTIGIGVMISGRIELDGKLWIHVSLSRKSRMPTYEDMTLVKRLFLGPDRRAIQLFVSEKEHYNYHPFCLHLWHCVDGDGLPDFRIMGGV